MLLSKHNIDHRGFFKEAFSDYDLQDGQFQSKTSTFFIHFRHKFSKEIIDFLVDKFFQDQTISLSEQFDILLISLGIIMTQRYL